MLWFNIFFLLTFKVLQKGQQRVGGSLVSLSNVSVPANTVQFREDGKLTCQVTYVVSANEIWCEQIYTEENVRGYQWSFWYFMVEFCILKTRFSEMIDRMKIYYEEHEAQLIPKEIVVSGYYIAKYEQEYYRWEPRKNSLQFHEKRTFLEYAWKKSS